MKISENPRFVKWAGGKQQLIEQFIPLFPKKFNNYFEPFVGSGAVALHIIQNHDPKLVHLSDSNGELINTYNIVKENVNVLITELKEHKKQHMSNKEEYFYQIRKLNPKSLSNLKRAARFIYLNKTCFNGLYRVNSKGEFNVPIGSYLNPDIVQEEKIKFISSQLKNVNITEMHFKDAVSKAIKGDFVYFDPPYYPLKKSSFTTYSVGNFLEKDHMELFELFEKLDNIGCKVMLSNSNTPFIKNLYSKYHHKGSIDLVKATRMINCDSSKREAIKELVIRNWKN